MEDTFHRKFTDTVSLAPEAEYLPNMQGSYKVRDLSEAASLSTEPQTQLTTYSATVSRAGQFSQIDTRCSAG